MNAAHLTKSYDGHVVLDIPSLTMDPGQICAVIGANGSGKSTLAQILAGILPSDNSAAPFPTPVRIGYMPQKSFAFRMSVLRNLTLTGASRTQAERILDQLMLSPLRRQSAKALSGGELARLALGRVLCTNCDVMILDEPTASMDMESTLLAENLIKGRCREQHIPVLMVTHSLVQAKRLADTVLFLHHGKAVEFGAAQDVLSNPSQRETRRFLEFYGQ